MSQITIRGRIATTLLKRGEIATVEHTERIDRLIAGGFVERVGPAQPASGRARYAAESATESAAMATTAAQSATEVAATETVSTAGLPRRKRKKTT